MTLPFILEKYRADIDRELKSIVGSRSGALYDMMRYHFGWIDKDGKAAAGNSGKALRPSLCLFSCEALGGNYKAAYQPATALELVHNFSLIHDDIQDNDRERHHRATVWAVYGQPQAINAGTAMRILANSALRRLKPEDVSYEKLGRLDGLLDEISLELIEGQYLDISFEERFDVSVADYLTMINGETAALISGSMEMGASLGVRPQHYIDSFRKIGRNLGLAFQIRDDVLGIWGDQKETGKTAGNDIRRRKKSFPVVHALEQARPALRKELISIYKKTEMDETEVSRVLEIFNTTGTQAKAQEKVDEYCRVAIQDFNALELAPVARQEMGELVQFLTGRKY